MLRIRNSPWDYHIYTKHVTACLNLVDSSKPSNAVAQRVHTVNVFGITLDKYGAIHPKSEFLYLQIMRRRLVSYTNRFSI